MLFKMIVIDDEYLVRMGIRETIIWENYDIEIIGEATNGKMGLEMIKNLHPDLIITDIKMPIMDGLELIKHIKANNFDCTVIILSGYKDFEYAKDTLENGAYSYLLKPIDNEELIEKVNAALTNLQEKRQRNQYFVQLQTELPTIKQKLFQQLLQGDYQDIKQIEEKLAIYQLDVQDSGTVIYGKIDDYQGMNPENASFAIKTFLNLIIQSLDSSPFYSEIDDSHFTLTSQKKFKEMEMICEDALKNYEKQNPLILSIGISFYEDLSTLKSAYLLAQQETEVKLFPMINTVSVSNSTTNKYSPQVIQAMRYITQNYSRNITVKMVSDSLFVSESYLMHLFKDNLKKTFNECLTDYRMMVAKQLLLSGKLKIYEIAELVGYNDSKYFSQIFKKKVGYSPRQYIDDDVMQ